MSSKTNKRCKEFLAADVKYSLHLKTEKTQ